MKQKKVRRIAQGLYEIPSAPSRFGPVPPDMDHVVAAIARRTGSRVQIAGEGALNRLGLSTQVPAVAMYRTDGPSRRLVVMGRPIVLRRVVARRLVAPGTVVGLVVEALRSLGREGVDEEIVAYLRKTLDPSDVARLGRIVNVLPEWQRRVVARIVDRE